MHEYEQAPAAPDLFAEWRGRPRCIDDEQLLVAVYRTSFVKQVGSESGDGPLSDVGARMLEEFENLL